MARNQLQKPKISRKAPRPLPPPIPSQHQTNPPPLSRLRKIITRSPTNRHAIPRQPQRRIHVPQRLTARLRARIRGGVKTQLLRARQIARHNEAPERELGTGFVVAEGQLVGEGRGGGVEIRAVGVAVHDEGQVGGAAGEVRGGEGGGEGGGGWGCGEGGGGGGGGGGVEGSGAGCEGEGGGEDEEGGEVLHFGGCLLRDADGILIWRRMTATVFSGLWG